jgi:hypothetical protein
MQSRCTLCAGRYGTAKSILLNVCSVTFFPIADPAVGLYEGVLKLQGATLWAADGTAYLDCVNNVAHVGHCNVKVSQTTWHGV